MRGRDGSVFWGGRVSSRARRIVEKRKKSGVEPPKKARVVCGREGAAARAWWGKREKRGVALSCQESRPMFRGGEPN